MITSFNRDSCANLPGVVCFHFAPATQVCEWPERDGVYINEEPDFTAPYEWLSGFAVMDSADFNEEPEETGAGTRYNTSFTGLFPKNSPGVLQLFSQMEKATHVIRITDKHGQIRLCGSPENPLRFRFTQNLGTGADSLNSYRFEFYGSSYEPSPYIINGAVPPIMPPFPPCPPNPGGGGENFERRHEFTGTYSYMAYAPQGSSESATVWVHTRINVAPDGTTTKGTATGAWTNRASLTYI